MKKAVLLGILAGWTTLMLLGLAFDVIPRGSAGPWAALGAAAIVPMIALASPRGFGCRKKACAAAASDPTRSEGSNPYATGADSD